VRQLLVSSDAESTLRDSSVPVLTDRAAGAFDQA
jgi:hypothetical protein